MPRTLCGSFFLSYRNKKQGSPSLAIGISCHFKRKKLLYSLLSSCFFNITVVDIKKKKVWVYLISSFTSAVVVLPFLKPFVLKESPPTSQKPSEKYLFQRRNYLYPHDIAFMLCGITIMINTGYAAGTDSEKFYYFNPDSSQSNLTRLKQEMERFLDKRILFSTSNPLLNTMTFIVKCSKIFLHLFFFLIGIINKAKKIQVETSSATSSQGPYNLS